MQPIRYEKTEKSQTLTLPCAPLPSLMPAKKDESKGLITPCAYTSSTSLNALSSHCCTRAWAAPML